MNNKINYDIINDLSDDINHLDKELLNIEFESKINKANIIRELMLFGDDHITDIEIKKKQREDRIIHLANEVSYETGTIINHLDYDLDSIFEHHKYIKDNKLTIFNSFSSRNIRKYNISHNMRYVDMLELSQKIQQKKNKSLLAFIFNIN